MVVAAHPLSRATSLTGRPIVSADGSSTLQVQDLVLDPDGRTVGGFTLREPGVFGSRHVAAISIADVASIGPDAIVMSSDEPFAEDTGEDLAVCSDVIGSDVITEMGVGLGKVTDVVVETRRNHVRVVALEIQVDGDPRYLVLSDTASVTGDVVMAPTGSESRLLETPEAVAAALDHD